MSAVKKTGYDPQTHLVTTATLQNGEWLTDDAFSAENMSPEIMTEEDGSTTLRLVDELGDISFIPLQREYGFESLAEHSYDEASKHLCTVIYDDQENLLAEMHRDLSDSEPVIRIEPDGSKYLTYIPRFNFQSQPKHMKWESEPTTVPLNALCEC